MLVRLRSDFCEVKTDLQAGEKDLEDIVCSEYVMLNAVRRAECSDAAECRF
jgi:hypothetical protein